MEETIENANKLRINLLQGRVTKLEKQLEALAHKLDIIERSLKR